MFLNNPSKALILPAVSNFQNHLYDEVIISLDIYYDAQIINADVLPEMILYINNQVVETKTLQTSGAVGYCHLFHSDRASRYQLLTQPLHINDNTVAVTV